jgi:hypothetical protein
VKLAWMFGSSMAARHLLYTYLTVWIIQGSYAGWAIWQWMRTRKASESSDIPSDC